jgi:hypothetical protein
MPFVCVCVCLPYASKKRAKQKHTEKKKTKMKDNLLCLQNSVMMAKGRGGVQGWWWPCMMMPSLRLGAIPFGMHKLESVTWPGC